MVIVAGELTNGSVAIERRKLKQESVVGRRIVRFTETERPDHRAGLVPLRRYALSTEKNNLSLFPSRCASIFISRHQAGCFVDCQTCDCYYASPPTPFGEAVFPTLASSCQSLDALILSMRPSQAGSEGR